MTDTPRDPAADSLLVEIRDGVATLTLNDPDRLNALDEPMLRRLADDVCRADADPAVRLIAVTGAGRGFCSGARLVPGVAGGDVGSGTLGAVGEVARALVGAATPTVALVNGPAAGAGCSIALACGYVLAAESAFFSLAFTQIGLMPDGGSTALVAASIGRARATRMALTGERVSAATAAQWGLIAEAVADDAYPARARELCAALAAGATRALGSSVRGINAATIDIEETLSIEEPGQSALMTGDDFAEGIAAFAAKRRPEFTGR